jgi:hypothetical protein
MSMHVDEYIYVTYACMDHTHTHTHTHIYIYIYIYIMCGYISSLQLSSISTPASNSMIRAIKQNGTYCLKDES